MSEKQIPRASKVSRTSLYLLLSVLKAFFLCFLVKLFRNHRLTIMPHSSSKIERISTTPDEELSSFDQIDRRALSQALIRKPTFEAHKALLAHRHTLECLIAKLGLKAEQYNTAFDTASDNYTKTVSALTQVCNYTASPYPKTDTPIVGHAFISILKLQKLYMDARWDASFTCHFEYGFVQGHLHALEKKAKKVERTLARSSNAPTIVDGEGKLLDIESVKRGFRDVVASVPGQGVFIE